MTVKPRCASVRTYWFRVALGMYTTIKDHHRLTTGCCLLMSLLRPDTEEEISWQLVGIRRDDRSLLLSVKPVTVPPSERRREPTKESKYNQVLFLQASRPKSIRKSSEE